jgi:hypothetical protein
MTVVKNEPKTNRDMLLKIKDRQKNTEVCTLRKSLSLDYGSALRHLLRPAFGRLFLLERFPDRPLPASLDPQRVSLRAGLRFRLASGFRLLGHHVTLPWGFRGTFREPYSAASRREMQLRCQLSIGQPHARLPFSIPMDQKTRLLACCSEK